MQLVDFELLPLAIFVLVPGFVAIKTFGLFVPGPHRKRSDSILEVFAYGAINFALFFWLLDLALSESASAAGGYSGLVLFLFVAPALVAFGTHRLLRSDRLRGWVVHPTPTG